MALFLQESQIPANDEVLSVNSLTEAFEALMDIAVEHSNLTEALLTADYTVEKQSMALTEAGKVDDATAKVKSFAANAAGAVKNFAARVWARIKDIARLVIRKVGEYASKLRGLTSGSVVNVQSNLADVVNEQIRFAEKTLHFIESSADAKGGVAPDKQLSYSNDFKDIPVSVIENLIGSVKTVAGKLEATATKMAGEAGRMGATDGAKGDISALKAKAAMGRAAAAHITKLATDLGRAVAKAGAKQPKPAAAAKPA